MQLLSQDGPNQILCFPADPQVVPGALAPPGQRHLQEQGPSPSGLQPQGRVLTLGGLATVPTPSTSISSSP